MKFLTTIEVQQWLSPLGAAIEVNREISFGQDSGKRALRLDAEYPKTPLQITYFAERVVDWLPRNYERLLWLSDWQTYPSHPLGFFELVRRGFGEKRHTIDAPGCVFNPDGGPKEQEFSAEPDTVPLAGFALLLMNFDWAGYLVSQDAVSISSVRFDDEVISFSTIDPTRFGDARGLCSQFNMTIKDRH
jgi:hypothetical protein